ncbi:unnamed protein product [Peniophora sp. CBMAI 1063]|nr:unnamed protein product [Peniophora sp. CBMAI 1063]
MAYSEFSYAEVLQDPEIELHNSRRQRKPHFLSGCSAGGRLGSTGMFFATAALSGFVCYLVFSFFSSHHSPPSHAAPGYDAHIPWGADAIEITSTSSTGGSAPGSGSSPVAPPLYYHEMSIEELTDLVATTRGYFARDYSLSLGWNNMRYIIEAAHLQATLLNRTLVLPSFVYARACEYELDACAAYAPMINKGKMVGSTEWDNRPYEQQMGFRVPIQYMLNVTRLRSMHPTITVAQYLRLHNLPEDLEANDGRWQREAYHVQAAALDDDQSHLPSLSVIENHWYDPWQTTRVDRVPDAMKERGGWVPEGGDAALGERGHWTKVELNDIGQHLKDGLGERSAVHDWDRAVELLRETDAAAHWDLGTDKGVQTALQANGWEVLYTFKSVLWMEFTRTVTEPTRQVVLRESIRGWVEEWVRSTEDVVLLVGETHVNRKPGAMRFTTLEARTDLENRVLHYVVPLDAMYTLAKRLADRMRNHVDGRLWMGAHMRRGDFVNTGWVMEKEPLDHVSRVRDRLSHGRAVLEGLKDVYPYPLPGVVVNVEQLTLDPPKPHDKFYVATDERDPEALSIIAENGAIFLDDLLTIDDRRKFGWPLMITDIRAVLEQSLLAHSNYFYAHAMSSVAGGIVNMRAAHGADPRTVLID